MLRLQRVYQRVDIHDGSTRGIDEMGALLHPRQLGCADHPMGLWSFRNVQRDKVGGLQQNIE